MRLLSFAAPGGLCCRSVNAFSVVMYHLVLLQIFPVQPLSFASMVTLALYHVFSVLQASSEQLPLLLLLLPFLRYHVLFAPLLHLCGVVTGVSRSTWRTCCRPSTHFPLRSNCRGQLVLRGQPFSSPVPRSRRSFCCSLLLFRTPAAALLRRSHVAASRTTLLRRMPDLVLTDCPTAFVFGAAHPALGLASFFTVSVMPTAASACPTLRPAAASAALHATAANGRTTAPAAASAVAPVCTTSRILAVPASVRAAAPHPAAPPPAARAVLSSATFPISCAFRY